MNKLFLLLGLLAFLIKADNEIYINQVGATLNLDVEQLGSSNIIGGLDAVSGQMSALNLIGSSMTLDINQLGDSNKFLGDIDKFSIDCFSAFEKSNLKKTVRKLNLAKRSPPVFEEVTFGVNAGSPVQPKPPWLPPRWIRRRTRHCDSHRRCDGSAERESRWRRSWKRPVRSIRR